MNQPDQTSRAAPAPSPAKPYTTPTLTTFGELAQLTKGASGWGMDDNGKFKPGSPSGGTAQRH